MYVLKCADDGAWQDSVSPLLYESSEEPEPELGFLSQWKEYYANSLLTKEAVLCNAWS